MPRALGLGLGLARANSASGPSSGLLGTLVSFGRAGAAGWNLEQTNRCGQSLAKLPIPASPCAAGVRGSHWPALLTSNLRSPRTRTKWHEKTAGSTRETTPLRMLNEIIGLLRVSSS